MIVWVVLSGNKVIGTVRSPSEIGAIRIASQKYGKNITLVRNCSS